VITVEVDAVEVERRLGEGLLLCPGCEGRLSRWGFARERLVRGMDDPVRPRRAKCRGGCEGTHVLLPVTCWLRRADTVEVIGAGLAACAGGAGHRSIAAELGRPESTVRGWLRRFGGRVAAIGGFFTAVAVRVGVDPVLPVVSGSGWGDALAAIDAAWVAVSGRFAGGGVGVGTVTVWQLACAVTSGALLSPSWRGRVPAW
jgi:hypothetical protein